ncbi:MAG: hypothetical protein IIX18_00355 [Clostridia bacterium]|nr:hypothetical protein [Clostridia bacterium]
MSENSAENLGGFASLLQNPDVLAKLPRIMEALAPVMEEMKAEKSEKVENKAPNEEGTEESTPASAPAENLLASFLSGGDKNGGSSPRYALLRALMPYLSDNRKEAMEYILKVSSLIDILSEVM